MAGNDTFAATPELIKLSLGNFHPVHDGLTIFFTVAAEARA